MVYNLHKKEAIPKDIPKEMEKKIKEFSKNRNKKEFVKKSFDYLNKKYKIDRVRFVTKLPDINKKDVKYLWNAKGFIYCISMNYLLRIMLVKSKFFKDSDIQLKLSNTWHLVPHQYLRIKISKKEYITVDPWAFQLGIKYGDFAHDFHAGKVFPKKN